MNPTTEPTRPVIDVSLIPQHVIEDLCRGIPAAVAAYYQDPEHERRFQEWVVGYRKRRAEKEGGKK